MYRLNSLNADIQLIVDGVSEKVFRILMPLHVMYYQLVRIR